MVREQNEVATPEVMTQGLDVVGMGVQVEKEKSLGAIKSRNRGFRVVDDMFIGQRKSSRMKGEDHENKTHLLWQMKVMKMLVITTMKR